MFKRNTVGVAAAALFCLLLLMVPSSKADLKYQQTTQVSGAMMDMMKNMPFMGNKVPGDVATTHYLKGDTLRVDTFTNGQLTSSEITRLDREEIIHIDHQKKTYSIMTFAQLRTQMEKSMAQMKKGDSNVQVTPKISVKDTGETKLINGFNTRHMILNMTFEAQDQKSEQKGSMDMASDLWITKDAPAFEEQRRFDQRMAEKLGTAELYKDAAAMMPGMMQDPKMSQGMDQMKKEMEKLAGTPILTIVSMNMAGNPAGAPPTASAAGQPSNSGEQASAKDSSTQEAMSKSLGKVFGGLGGFGRKKQPAAQEAPPTASQTQAAPASGANAQPYMKTTSEIKSVSNSGLTDDLFIVPSGYQQK